MAHLVYQIDGKDSMAFVGDTPWHGLGQKLNPNMPLDIWMKEANLDWTIKQAPVQFKIKGVPGRATFDGRKVLYRSDNNAPLSVVSDRYQIVQPSEILYFYEDLVKEYGFEMETAGSLDKGRRVWALAKLGQSVRIMGQDAIDAYLLLATSCDGTLSTTAMLTSVRVVCNNTLQFAYNKSDANSNGISVKVPHSCKFDPRSVKIEMGLIQGAWSDFINEVDLLAHVPVTLEQATSFFINLYHKEVNGLDYSDVPESALKGLAAAFTGAPGADLKSSSGTAWGLVNAVTYYHDHTIRARGNDNRMKSAWFGNGALMKKKAYEAAVAMAKAA